MFIEADIDGDGIISYDDFSRIMLAKWFFIYIVLKNQKF